MSERDPASAIIAPAANERGPGEVGWWMVSTRWLGLGWRCVSSAACAGVAMGQHLQKHPPATQTANAAAPNWPGLQGALDPLLWVFFLTGAFVNSATLRPRVAYAPASLPRHFVEGVLHQQSATALLQAEHMLDGFQADAEAPADEAAAAGGAPDVRRVLDAVFAALPNAGSRADVERVSADDVAGAARIGRARGVAGVVAQAVAGAYSVGAAARPEAEQHGLLRMADDVREAAGVFRAAAKHACVPLGVASEAGVRGLGDAVEAALDTALAGAASVPASAAVGGDADVEMADSEGNASGGGHARAAATGGEGADGALGRFRAVLEQADQFVVEPSAPAAAARPEDGVAASSQQLEGLNSMAQALLEAERCALHGLAVSGRLSCRRRWCPCGVPCD